MRLAVMVCARDEAVRCQDQLSWFLHFFGLEAGRILREVEKGEGVENACCKEFSNGCAVRVAHSGTACVPLLCDVQLLVKRSVITFAGAGAAKNAAVYADFAFEIYAFAALGADDAGAFEAGEIFGMNFDAHPLLVE